MAKTNKAPKMQQVHVGASFKPDQKEANPKTLTVVGHDTVDGPEHPLYDPRVKLPPDQTMVESIKADGVLVPVLITLAGEVVAGRRRVTHARIAGLASIPVSVVEETDPVKLAVVSMTENEIRKDDDDAMRAHKIARLVEAVGKKNGVKRASVVFGIGEAQVRNYRQIDQHATEEVKKAFGAGEIGMAVALACSKLAGDADGQAELLAKARAGATTKEVEEAGRGRRGTANGGGTGTRESTPRPAKDLVSDFADVLESYDLKEEAELLRWTIGGAEGKLSQTMQEALASARSKKAIAQ